jgi:carotenoid cleavage dioxygenase-like enzyme
MTLRRRDVLKLGAAALALPTGCASTKEAPVSTASPARVRAWNRILTASPGDLEHTVHASAIDGRIPDALRGARYLLNGPGRLGYGGDIAHPFDGHGYLRTFSFDEDGGVSVRARFVHTPAFLAEEKAQKLVYPGLGTLPEEGAEPPKGAVRNVANTTVVPWADRLLCGWEAGTPWALHKESLATLGAERFGEALPEGAVLAHMRIDPISKRLIALSPSLGLKTGLDFRELDEAGNLLASRKVEVAEAMFIHDFVVTKNWYVIARNPMSVDFIAFARAQMGRDVLINAIRANNDKPGALVLIPRAGNAASEVRIVEIGAPAYVVHFGNAFEDQGDLVVDLCAMPDATFGNEFGFQGPRSPLDPALPDVRKPQRVLRTRIPAGATTSSVQQLTKHAMDFPRVPLAREGQAARTMFAATRRDLAHSDPFDAIARVDLDDLEREEQVWSPGGDRFMGEPVFFHTPGAAREDEGYVVANVYDGAAEQTTLCVFDADKIHDGPVASVPFKLLPYGFHGWPEERRA